MSETKGNSPELVTIKVDDKEIRVPKGTNLIDAAKQAGIEIPHYCYHPHLSIAGNCRMCQVELVGQPKLGIACNTTAAEGLNVRTHFTSPQVAEAQRATLEFLLINHPLDCTVCDQAGHCKLQDYYYEYDSTGSRFIEEKVHKVKAEPLGPKVIYDGERCIMCTRCVRFCDEIAETSELGAYNRGDKGFIGVVEGHELKNPLSGTVVDLCPVGALTHRDWRFNTRIWYTSETKSVCPGCSTGCNVFVSVRDDQVVHVKARLNSDVNKEWLCDEGRYGFERFQPKERSTEPLKKGTESFQKVGWNEALQVAAQLKGSAGASDVAVFLSPFLTLEELWTSVVFAEQTLGLTWGSGHMALQLSTRELSKVEAKLLSPDYAPNAKALHVLGHIKDEANFRAELEKNYRALLSLVRAGKFRKLLFVGDRAVLDSDLDEGFQKAVLGAEISVAISPSAVGGSQKSGVQGLCKVVLPSRTVNEKSGVFVNQQSRLQRLGALLTPPVGSLADWMILNRIAASAGKALLSADIIDERGLFREMVKRVPRLNGLTLMKIGDSGILLSDVEKSGGSQGAASQASAV